MLAHRPTAIMVKQVNDMAYIGSDEWDNGPTAQSRPRPNKSAAPNSTQQRTLHC